MDDQLEGMIRSDVERSKNKEILNERLRLPESRWTEEDETASTNRQNEDGKVDNLEESKFAERDEEEWGDVEDEAVLLGEIDRLTEESEKQTKLAREIFQSVTRRKSGEETMLSRIIERVTKKKSREEAKTSGHLEHVTREESGEESRFSGVGERVTKKKSRDETKLPGDSDRVTGGESLTLLDPYSPPLIRVEGGMRLKGLKEIRLTRMTELETKRKKSREEIKASSEADVVTWEESKVGNSSLSGDTQHVTQETVDEASPLGAKLERVTNKKSTGEDSLSECLEHMIRDVSMEDTSLLPEIGRVTKEKKEECTLSGDFERVICAECKEEISLPVGTEHVTHKESRKEDSLAEYLERMIQNVSSEEARRLPEPVKRVTWGGKTEEHGLFGDFEHDLICDECNAEVPLPVATERLTQKQSREEANLSEYLERVIQNDNTEEVWPLSEPERVTRGRKTEDDSPHGDFEHVMCDECKGGPSLTLATDHVTHKQSREEDSFSEYSGRVIQNVSTVEAGLLAAPERVTRARKREDNSQHGDCEHGVICNECKGEISLTVATDRVTHQKSREGLSGDLDRMICEVCKEETCLTAATERVTEKNGADEAKKPEESAGVTRQQNTEESLLSNEIKGATPRKSREEARLSKEMERASQKNVKENTKPTEDTNMREHVIQSYNEDGGQMGRVTQSNREDTDLKELVTKDNKADTHIFERVTQEKVREESGLTTASPDSSRTFSCVCVTRSEDRKEGETMETEDGKMTEGAKKEEKEAHGEKEEEQGDLGFEYPDDGVPYDRGWAWMTVLAAFVVNLISLGHYRAFLIFFVEFLKEFNAPVSQTALLFFVGLSIHGVVGFFILNTVISRLGVRKAVFIGGICLTLSSILPVFATDLVSLIFSHSFLHGIGLSMVNMIPTLLIGRYFKKRLSFAVTVSECGIGIGGMTLPPLTTYLLLRYGLRGALLLSGGICMNILPAAALMRPASFYKKRKRQSPEVTPSESGHALPGPCCHRTWRAVRRAGKVLDCGSFRSPMFLALAGSFITEPLELATVFYLPAIIEDRGMTEDQAAYVLSIMCGIGVSSRFITGYVADLVSLKKSTIIAAHTLLLGALTHVIPLLTSFSHVVGFSVAYGYLRGATPSLVSVMILEEFGLEKTAPVLGFRKLLSAGSLAAAMPLLGYFRDVTGDYDLSNHVTGFLTSMSGVFLVVFGLLSDRKRTRRVEPYSQMELEVQSPN